ncbi:MAG: TonB-dependent receptor [bacterium]
MRLPTSTVRGGLFALSTLAALLPALGQAQNKKPGSDESLLLGEIPSVFGASRFDQAVTEAPASVSVITSEEIATYGWRTLSELLRTVRGFYVTDDRTYTYVGARGFSRPGDYNTRILVLLDGVRVNEHIFDGGYSGNEGLVDLNTVDRVEIIRGPGSTVYGNNALFGVINVISKRGRAERGVTATSSIGSFGSNEMAIRAGERTAFGLEFFGSLSRLRVAGQDHYYPEFDTPLNSHGVAAGRDAERRDNAFAKLEWGSWALEGAGNLRDKTVPTASYATLFNTGHETVRDVSGTVALRYSRGAGESSNLSGSVSLNRYDWYGDFPYSDATAVNWSHGRWSEAEAQYTRLVFGKNRVVTGAAYTHNWRQEQGSATAEGETPYFLDNTTRDTYGLFVLGEFRLSERLIINAGLRDDHASGLADSWNPRGALIYSLGDGSALKVLYGSAYRAANNYERFYSDDGISQEANPALTPERVTTFEILAEKLLSRHVKGTASVYQYRARQLINAAVDETNGLLQFNNLGRANGEGIETEVELELGMLTGRASYALQRAWDPEIGGRLSNSPQHLGALNLSVPIASGRARTGFEVRGMSTRMTPAGNAVPGHVVASVVLSSRRLVKGAECSAGVFNVFNAVYSDPVGEEHLEKSIRQDGRAVRLSLGYAF